MQKTVVKAVYLYSHDPIYASLCVWRAAAKMIYEIGVPTITPLHLGAVGYGPLAFSTIRYAVHFLIKARLPKWSVALLECQGIDRVLPLPLQLDGLWVHYPGGHTMRTCEDWPWPKGTHMYRSLLPIREIPRIEWEDLYDEYEENR